VEGSQIGDRCPSPREWLGQLAGDAVPPVGARVEVGVDADDRQPPSVSGARRASTLLDLAALVLGFHGAENAAALVDPFELGRTALDQIGSSSMMKAPAEFSLFASPSSLVMII
jgi:hypothetical protein